MLEIARGYIRRGWCVVRVLWRGKRPIGENWQHLRITEETAPQYFNGAGYNIGLLLGGASGGLTDVDLDCPEAIRIASYVLPVSQSIFGRASARNSHRLYITDLWRHHDTAVLFFKDPRTKEVIAELRIGGGNLGAQTVAPGSTHESGEEVSWDIDGDAAQVDGETLVEGVRRVAALALIAKHWPGDGSRHEAASIVGGFLARVGLTPAVCRIYVEAIAKAAHDPEPRNRRETAEDAAKAFAADKNTYGYPALASMFGRDIADQVAEWLNFQSDSTPGAPHPDAPQSTETRPPPAADYKRLWGLRINFGAWDNQAPPEQDWGVWNRFPARESAILSGEGAVGKSTTLLHLTAAHPLGVDWLGAILDKGPAFFIDCEDEDRVIWRRLAPICNYYKVTFSDLVAGGLELISLKAHDPILAVASRSGRIETTKRYAELIEMAGDLKPKCITIASSANVFAGNENDRSQVQQFAGHLTKVALIAGGYLVLAQHPSLTGINNGSGLSGTTQWHNAMRARAYMRGMSAAPDEQPDNDMREIVFKKNQYGKLDETIVLKWTDGMYLPVRGLWSLDKAAAEQKADEVFLKLLKRFNAQGQDVNASPSRGYAPAVLARHPDADGLTAKQLGKAMQRLLDAKAIIVEISGSPSRQRKRLVVS